MISVQTLKTLLYVCANLWNRDVSLLLPWIFVDDALEEHCWNLDNFDGNFFDFYCFCSVNLWITDVSLLLHRWFFDVSLKNHWSYSEDFVASLNDLQGFLWLNLGNVDVSLLLRRWLVDDSLERHNWNIGNFDGSLFIPIVFVVLTSESLTFHCFFLDDSLMILWRALMKLRKFGCKHFWSLKFLMCWSSNFGVSLQLEWLIVVDDSLNKRWWDLDDFDAKIIDENFLLWNSPKHWCFIAASSMIPWWPFGDILETLIFSMETFLIFIVIVVFFSESLLFHCFFIDEWLMTLWRNIDGTTKISMQTLKIIEVSNVLIIRTLMFLCCLIDYSLMILWWIFDNTLMISLQT